MLALLSTEDAAYRFGLSPRTLEKWRVTGGGPPYRKLGRLVRYDEGDLEAWLEVQRRVSTADPGGEV